MITLLGLSLKCSREHKKSRTANLFFISSNQESRYNLYLRDKFRFGQYTGGDEIFNSEAIENAKVVDTNNLF
jgi:hypothetical protein